MIPQILERSNAQNGGVRGRRAQKGKISVRFQAYLKSRLEMPIIEIGKTETLRGIQDLVWACSFVVAGRPSVER